MIKKKTTPTPKTKTAQKETTPKEVVPKKTSLPFFPVGTPREDKISLFSFCLGMIVMACFFVLDLQIRNHIEMERANKALIMSAHRAKLTYLTNQIRARQAKCGCQKKYPMAQKHTKKNCPVKCPPVWQRQAQFNPTEYAPYDVAGTLTLSGNICSDLPKGSVCPEKIDVFVNPKTTYSEEWWTKHWTGTNGISKTDERALKYNKHGTVKKGGDFTIEKLPAGTYYVGAITCVKNTEKAPCKPVRLGTEIQLDKSTRVSLKQVFPIQ